MTSKIWKNIFASWKIKLWHQNLCQTVARTQETFRRPFALQKPSSVWSGRTFFHHQLIHRWTQVRLTEVAESESLRTYLSNFSTAAISTQPSFSTPNTKNLSSPSQHLSKYQTDSPQDFVGKRTEKVFLWSDFSHFVVYLKHRSWPNRIKIEMLKRSDDKRWEKVHIGDDKKESFWRCFRMKYASSFVRFNCQPVKTPASLVRVLIHTSIKVNDLLLQTFTQVNTMTWDFYSSPRTSGSSDDSPNVLV